ncbi:MAG: hypothetical protein U9Q12_04480, partial [Patescibacteria group bacterium]|nr:hypothetical protein [Patescibacteria group bacterium]
RSCSCGMLVGCWSLAQGGLFCETDCESGKQLQCAFSFDERSEEEKQVEVAFVEECWHCQSDGDFIEDEGAPAFLSDAVC